MNKKGISITENAKAMAQELLESKPLHEVESLILDNQNKRLESLKKEKEISMLENQLNDYRLTKIMAWLGAICGTIAVVLKLIELFGK